MTIGKTVQDQKFHVEEDPRIVTTKADREAQFKLLMRLNTISASASDTRKAVDAIKEEIDSLEANADFKKSDSEELKATVTSIKEKLKTLEDRLANRNTAVKPPTPTPVAGAAKSGDGDSPPAPPPSISLASKISTIIFNVDAITEAPSASSVSDTKKLGDEIGKISREVNTLISGDVAKLNGQLKLAKLKVITMPAKVMTAAWTGDRPVYTESILIDTVDDDQP